MRSFSKGRVLFFCLLLGAVCISITASNSWAEGEPGAGGEPVHHSNPFSLIIHNIDFVAVLVGICSIFGVTLIIQGFIKNRRSVMMPEATTNHMRELIANRQFKELIEFTETDPSFISRALNPALKRAPSFPAMKEAMETSLGEQTADQFRKIEFLNIIGNLGPLLGLLGTVLGMINAFQAMTESGGQADPGKLAGGISQALCHTMLGLLLAIPCLASFGVLRTMVDRLTVSGALLAEELLLAIKPTEKSAVSQAARTGATPSVAPAVRKAPIPAPPIPAQG